MPSHSANAPLGLGTAKVAIILEFTRDERLICNFLCFFVFLCRIAVNGRGQGLFGRIACVAKRPERRRRARLKREAGESPALFPQL